MIIIEIFEYKWNMILGNIFPWKLKRIYSNISFIDLNSFHISKTVSFIIIIYLLYAVTAC